MARSLLFIWSLVLLCVGVGFASEAYESETLRRSDLLFPATRSWRVVADCPRPDPEWLASERERLRGRFLTEFGSTTECAWADCDADAFYRHPELIRSDGFRLFDVDADGVQDLIYTGPAIGYEGAVTHLWFRAEPTVADPKPVTYGKELLRVAPGGTPGLAMVQPNSSDPVAIHTLDAGDGLAPSAFAIDVRMTLPSGTTSTDLRADGGSLNSSGELVLRGSPRRDDAFDANQSGFAGRAVFGNVLRRYSAGTRARILAGHVDADGKTWWLVAVDSSEEHRVLQEAWPVHVGWTER